MKISTSICIIVMLATNYYAILNDTIMILILQFYSRWKLLLLFFFLQKLPFYNIITIDFNIKICFKFESILILLKKVFNQVFCMRHKNFIENNCIIFVGQKAKKRHI